MHCNLQKLNFNKHYGSSVSTKLLDFKMQNTTKYAAVYNT